MDRELNELGERQALLIGEALKSVPVTLVASSPLSRAFRTADLAMSVACPGVEGVRIHPGLREMNFGELEGAVAAESSLYAEVNAAWASGDVERKWPAGESPRDVELRGRQALAGLGLLGQKDGPLHTHVAVVCHGRFNKMLSSLLGGASTMRRDPAGQLSTLLMLTSPRRSTWHNWRRRSPWTHATIDGVDTDAVMTSARSPSAPLPPPASALVPLTPIRKVVVGFSACRAVPKVEVLDAVALVASRTAAAHEHLAHGHGVLLPWAPMPTGEPLGRSWSRRRSDVNPGT